VPQITNCLTQLAKIVVLLHAYHRKYFFNTINFLSPAYS